MKTAMGIALAAAVATTAGCWWWGGLCETHLHPWGEMPDLDMQVGDTAETPLTDYFRPVQCIEDGYPGPGWFVDWSDSAAIAVSVSASSGYRTLTTVALEVADSVRVTVEMPPDDEYSNGHEFFVRVRPSVDDS